MLESHCEWHELADAEMIGWCAKLNAIQGIKTYQSCSGHKVGDVGKAEGLYRYEAPGNLWFTCDWMTPEIAFDLARISTVERVRLIFFPEGKAMWDLTFAGKNKDCLDKSMKLILQTLRGQCDGQGIDAGVGGVEQGEE